MPYACPVCEEPQADGEHLANHLAFSAMLGRADHADWLDEHAPGWDEEGPEELAERVLPHAESVELDVETADDVEIPDPGSQSGPLPGGMQGAAGPAGSRGTPETGRERLDPEAKRILEEARTMTERRREAGEDEDEPGAVDGDTDADEADDVGAGDETDGALDADAPDDTDGMSDADTPDDADGGDTDSGDGDGGSDDGGDGDDEKR